MSPRRSPRPQSVNSNKRVTPRKRKHTEISTAERPIKRPLTPVIPVTRVITVKQSTPPSNINRMNGNMGTNTPAKREISEVVEDVDATAEQDPLTSETRSMQTVTSFLEKTILEDIICCLCRIALILRE
jgi:hypothetical protein